MRLTYLINWVLLGILGALANHISPQHGEAYVSKERTQALFQIYPNLAVIQDEERGQKFVVYDIYDFKRLHSYEESDTESESGPLTPSDDLPFKL